MKQKNKHAFLIVAFQHPDYVDSLIVRLGGGTSCRTNIYVHVDLKSVNKFYGLVHKYEKCGNVKFISKHSLHWGGYQIIDTEKELLQLALADKDNFYFHLLSDSDFLCRPLHELIDYFDDFDNQGKEYMECAPVEEIWSKTSIRLRFFCWNMHDIIDTRKWHLGLVNRFLCKLQWLLHIRRPAFPYRKFYGGSSWWTISKLGANTLLNAFEDKRIVRRFKFIYAPDEVFPATVIANSGLLVVSDYCLRNRDAQKAGIVCFRYIPWWKKGSRKVHPLTLIDDDYFFDKKE